MTLVVRMRFLAMFARELLRMHRRTYASFWAWSDGVLDHPGGENSRAFGPRRLLQHLASYRHLGAEALMMQTKTVVDQWRGQETRRDDVSALAFSV